MQPTPPEQTRSGLFINPARVQRYTAGCPDTTEDYSRLYNIPYETLRQGFPRDPTLHLSRSLNRLPESLSARLKELPSFGTLVSRNKPEDTLKFTSTNPAYLLGEDYEMSEYPNTANPHDVEVTLSDIGRESSTVADAVALDNTTPSDQQALTAALLHQELPPLVPPPSTPQAAARAADMNLDARAALLETLTTVGAPALDALTFKMTKRYRGTRNIKPPSETVQTQTSGTTLRALQDELGGDTVSEEMMTLDGETDTRAGTSDAALKLIYRGEQIDRGASPTPSDVRNPDDDHMWMDDYPKLKEKYKVGPYSPELLLFKYKKTVLEIQSMMLRCDKDYFSQLGQFRVVEWLICAIKLMAGRVVADIKAHQQGAPLVEGIPLDVLEKLRDELLTCTLEDPLTDCVSMDFGGVMTHASLLLQWQLTASNRMTTDIICTIEDMNAQIDHKLKSHIAEVDKICGSVKDGIELERGLRNTTSRDIETLTEKVSQLLTTTNALTTQVNNLSSVVAQAGFTIKQGTLTTDTRLPQAATIPSVSHQPPVNPPVQSRALALLKQSINRDIEEAVPSGTIDKEKAILARVSQKPELLRHYHALSEHYNRALSTAQITAIHMAVTPGADTDFPRTAIRLEHYLSMIPSGPHDPLKPVLAEIFATVEAEKEQQRHAPQPAGPQPLLTPQASDVQVSGLLQRVRAAKLRKQMQ